ncbi:MAG: hypothetical protein MZU97_20440 [Bacillus subtilis]|nr:hypothetical protein [Bacillus subtilis]
MEKNKPLSSCVEHCGKQFDPAIVKVFIEQILGMSCENCDLEAKRTEDGSLP